MTDLPPDLQIRVDAAPDDPRWDQFLEQVPGGHHVQSSMWARVKATVGFRADRVIAERDGQIVAGAQILSRPVSRLGRVGYLANGPIAAPSENAAATAVLQGVETVAREQRIRHLTVQPPLGAAQPFQGDERAYRPGSVYVTPGATIMLDLTGDIDAVLAAMQRKTRYNIRVSARKGIAVRSGSADDLGLYHQMLVETAKRQGFTPFPREYFDEMWRALSPGGHLRLAVAEYEGSPISAQLAVAFGGTVVNKLSVWSGREGARRPNEAIQWSTMQWAKENGYAAYDLEGISTDAAQILLAGEPLPDSFDQTVTSFKLGYGGQVVMSPPPRDYLYNRAARWAFTELYPRVSRHRTVKRFVKRLRTNTPK
jgi:lipid II:glycine glycyltransferase (peptidoglycan interpeptide bridge formation enzyme)